MIVVRFICRVDGELVALVLEVKMPFSSYKSISAVAKKFQLKYVLSDYIVGIELPVKAAFKEELFAAVNYVFRQCELQVAGKETFSV